MTESQPTKFSSFLQKTRLGGNPYTFLYLLLLVAFLSTWNTLVTHDFSLKALGIFSLLCAASLGYGRLFFKLIPSSRTINTGLTIQFLCGYFALNTLGFVMSFITTLSIAGNILILCAYGFLGLLFLPGNSGIENEEVDFFPDILCLLLSGVGATLWCADSLNPIAGNGHFVTYQMWIDSFFHAREISIFSQSHGLKTIFDIQMSGAPASIYHYACYVIPAAIVSITNTGAFEIFASFLLPFGILLTGLAAFSLTSAIWGKWPGIAGTVAAILLPDAYQQGFQNKLLSCNFLQQVNPGGLYGVALIAIAWMFILDGCKTGKFTAIFLGYAIAMVSMAYKAQLFVANAFLIMIYPCLFFEGLKIRWRLVAAILFTTLFVCVVSLSQHSSAIPTLRLDGSGAKHYAYTILASYDRGLFRGFFYRELTGLKPLLFDLSMACMVMIASFGLWIVACPLVFFLQKPRPHIAAWLFPVFVIANYLIMAVGLALDEKKIGMPEELLHRPLVWAYFVVAAWTGAAAYVLLLGNGRPGSPFARGAMAVLIFAGLLTPVTLAHNLQTMPAWPGYGDYASFNSIPVGFVKASLYIRKHSDVDDIVQDSENDYKLILTALAERQDFVIHSTGVNQLRVPKGLEDRVKDITAFKQMTNEADTMEFAKKNHISWYLLEPQTEVSWPASLLEKAVFSSGGYRVYHFPS